MYTRTACTNRRRRGLAIVEFAILLPFLLLLIAGVWEIGRLVNVKLMTQEAAREGARLAAQAVIVTDQGGFTLVTRYPEGPSTTPMERTIKSYLIGCGLTAAQVNAMTFTFAFNNPQGRTEPWQPPPPGPPQRRFPDKGELFTVTVSIPYSAVRWSNFNFSTAVGLLPGGGAAPPNPVNISSRVVWGSLCDQEFNVNTDIP